MGIICANPDDPVYFLKVKAGELLKETRKEIHPKKFCFWAYTLDENIMNISYNYILIDVLCMNDIINESYCSVNYASLFFFPTNSPGSSCISFRSESKVISGMGPALGQALAGFVGSSAGWRAPFALVGAAGLVMSLGRTCGCWRVLRVCWCIVGCTRI